jgi:iron complex outermembrane recepter protein
MTKLTGYTRSPLALALAAALLPIPGLALAQDDTDDNSEEEEQLEQIVVVGSRIKRAEVEGPAPVTVITRDDIDREGFQTVGDVLESLNQNTTSSFTGELATAGFSPNAQVVTCATSVRATP